MHEKLNKIVLLT